MGHRVGIDLGTTNSLLAFSDAGERRCAQLEGDEFPMAVFPSCVGQGPDGEPVYGLQARRLSDSVREFKRQMGTDRTWQLGGREYSAVQLSALLLAEMKTRFEARHGPIESAVITVPANFTDRQRHETREAGHLAGLEVSRVINEPSAAAIAYSLSDRPPGENAIVIDWGGGTLDVSLLDCIGDVLDVKANDGDRTCGGKDVDTLVLTLMEKKVASRLGKQLQDADVQRELALKSEAIKIHLSTEAEWDEPIDLHCRHLFLDFTLTRKELEAAAEPLVDRVLQAARRCLDKAPEGALDPYSVSDVILVGGSCRIPLLQRRVKEFFGQTGRMDLNHLEVVALGAAYQAQHAGGGGDLITVHSLATSLGVGCTGKDRQGVLRSNLFQPILPATSKLPAQGTHRFSTLKDDQTKVLVSIFETENQTTEGLDPWDTRLIEGLPPAPAGTVPIHVTFAYTVEQILRVQVEVEGTDIREEWKAAFRRDLEEERPTSAVKVAEFRSTSLDALAEFGERVRAALADQAAAEPIESLLARLEEAIAAQDLAAGMAAKRALGVALFDEGFSLG